MTETNKVRVGINGFGRIGRMVLRAALEDTRIEICAINDPGMNAELMAYLFKYDSTHGPYDGYVSHRITLHEPILCINHHHIPIYSYKLPYEIPWNKNQIDIVAECSGHYLTNESAYAHIQSGAKKVLLSAPPKDSHIPLFVYGVNHTQYNPADMHILSNASCTTNCLAPLLAVIHEKYVVEEALMTTIHAVTATQSLLDGSSNKGYTEGRSGMENIIPSTTGAATSVGQVIPELKGKITGMSLRVPVSDVSIVDVVCHTQHPITLTNLINDIKNISGTNAPMEGIIGLSHNHAVSSDFKGDKRSCIVDAHNSIILTPNFMKIIAFYDNEVAYATRMVDMMCYMKAICIDTDLRILSPHISTTTTTTTTTPYMRKHIPPLSEYEIRDEEETKEEGEEVEQIMK